MLIAHGQCSDKLGHAAEPSDSTLLSSLQIGDEAMLIEKRRQKREAIKAKHRSSTVAAPYLASAFNDRRGPNLTLNLSEVHSMDNFMFCLSRLMADMHSSSSLKITIANL